MSLLRRPAAKRKKPASSIRGPPTSDDVQQYAMEISSSLGRRCLDAAI